VLLPSDFSRKAAGRALAAVSFHVNPRLASVFFGETSMFRMPTKVEYNPLMKRWQILRKINGRWERVRFGFRTRAEARENEYWYSQPHTPG
jgi:hypothetical protein